MNETTEPRREFDTYTRDQLIAEINRLRAHGWKRDNTHSDTLTALRPVLVAALRVDGGENGVSENVEDFEALADALGCVPWTVYDELGITEGAPL